MNIDDIRHNPAFPGGLKNIIAEFDERLKALEEHHPLLAELKAKAQEHAVQPIAEAPVHLRDEDVPTERPKRSGLK